MARGQAKSAQMLIFNAFIESQYMKYVITFLALIFITSLTAQEKVNPVIKNFGGIYDIPEATVKPDVTAEYKIVVDVYGGAEDKSKLDASLNNSARMINLHAVAGVPVESMKIVLALHGQSTYSAMSDAAYKEKFGSNNPNTPLIQELKAAGVRIAVCGQSLRGRSVQAEQLLKEVEVATSMLTTVTHYQNQGYMLLKF